MLSKVLSASITGIDAYMVEVEVDISSGLPAFLMVGLPEGAIKEGRERIKSAIKNSGYRFPSDRITVNLAPADIKKEGTSFDLPVALGILCASGVVSPSTWDDYLILGELSLDGLIRPVKGVLPIAIMAEQKGLRGIFLPKENAIEASVIDGINIYPVGSLPELVEAILGRNPIEPFVNNEDISLKIHGEDVDFSDVKGQDSLKRAMEISAAGGHNLLMIGPPGSGKTMMARRLFTILPEMSFDESLETSKIYSVLGLMPPGAGLITQRPFRSPHHTISDAGLVGGGKEPRPGEVSLAHNGVLFLDELPEFKRNVLEVLRQPLEDGHVTISRASGTIRYPARFQLISAMNPCPCGNLGHPGKECQCTPIQIQRYRSRISGPLLDRIDIHIEVPPVNFRDLSSPSEGESSSAILERVKKARTVQRDRFSGLNIKTNTQMNSRHIKEFCRLDKDSIELLEKGMERLSLSARAHNKILKVARTIADLEGAIEIKAEHIAEAIQYRSLDRQFSGHPGFLPV